MVKRQGKQQISTPPLANKPVICLAEDDLDVLVGCVDLSLDGAHNLFKVRVNGDDRGAEG